MNLKCYICSEILFSSKHYIRHLKLYHGLKDENKPKLRCGVSICLKVYSSFSGLRRHLKLYHASDKDPNVETVMIDDEVNDLIEDETVAGPSHAVEVHSNLVEGALLTVAGQSSQSTAGPSYSINDDRLDFYNEIEQINIEQLQERSCYTTPDEMLRETLPFDDSSKKLVDEFMANIRNLNIPEIKIDSILKNVTNLTSNVALSIKNSLDVTEQIIISPQLNFLATPFKNHLSKFKRTQHLLEMKTPIAEEISLSIRRDMRWCRGSQSYVFRPKTNSFMYTSIIKTLSFLCENKYFLEHMFNITDSIANEIRGPRDGKRYKESELYSLEPFSFMIKLYCDEFETTNPIGSKTVVHKIFGIYFSILNLPLEINSKLENIFLLGLCIAIDLKKEELFDKIFKCITEDFKILESDGIPVIYNGEQHKLKGTIFDLSHDNLAANFICGFNESFSSTNYCRFCLSTADECKSMTNDSACILRNGLDNEIHVRENLFGSKRHCPMNDLKYFNSFKCPSVDVMHDILEGIGPYELKKFLIFIVKEVKIIKIEEVNMRLSNFNFGYLNVKNKPSFININAKSNSLGQKASQFWCLLRFFPLIFKDCLELNMDKVDRHLKVILMLIRICLLCFAHRLPGNAPNILKDNIHDHHTLFIELYGNDAMIPKHHLLIHYPMVMEQMGPLVLQWTMRFEGKHAFFKLAASNAHNYINICKTLSRKHEFYFANKYSENKFQNEVEVKTDFSIRICNILPDELMLFIRNTLNLSDDTNITFIETLKVGYEYRSGCCYICNASNFILLPSFGKIFKILKVFNQFYFVIQKQKTMSFNEVVCGYEIEHTIELEAVKIVDVEFPKPYESHSPLNSSKKFIIPKFIL